MDHEHLTAAHQHEYATTDFERQLRNQDAGLASFERTCFARHFNPEARTLDLGTGGGRIALALSAGAGYSHVVALDFVADFVQAARRRARERGADVRFAAGNALQLCFKDQSFDQIIAGGVLLSHFPSRDLRLQTLSEIRRVLKAGGLAFVNVHNARLGARVLGVASLMKLLRAVRGNEEGYWSNDLPRLGSRAGRFDPFFWRRGKSHLHYYYLEEFVLDVLCADLAVVEINGFGPDRRQAAGPRFWRLWGVPSLQAVLLRRG